MHHIAISRPLDLESDVLEVHLHTNTTPHSASLKQCKHLKSNSSSPKALQSRLVHTHDDKMPHKHIQALAGWVTCMLACHGHAMDNASARTPKLHTLTPQRTCVHEYCKKKICSVPVQSVQYTAITDSIEHLNTHKGAVEDIHNLKDGWRVIRTVCRVSLDDDRGIGGAPHVIHPQTARQCCTLQEATDNSCSCHPNALKACANCGRWLIPGKVSAPVVSNVLRRKHVHSLCSRVWRRGATFD